MKKTKRLLGVIATVLLAVAIASMATYMAASDDSKDEFLDAFMQMEEEGATRQIDWDALPPEVIAWVEVPGTNIDEPIVQATPDAPNAYLYKDALGQGAYGTPYIDCDCSLDSPFTMIYGHHMSDGSVFADFANFIDEAYAREHNRIIIYERSGRIYDLDVIAVDLVNASCERLVIPSPEEFNDRVDSCDLLLNISAEPRRLWAFTTCSYQTANSRTIVFCMKV